MTKLVNCRDSHYDVFIGKTNSELHFGNPFGHVSYILPDIKVKSREEAVTNYEKWLLGKDFLDLDQKRRKWILSQLPLLENKILGSHNPPLRCHGEVLIKLIENYEAL